MNRKPSFRMDVNFLILLSATLRAVFEFLVHSTASPCFASKTRARSLLPLGKRYLLTRFLYEYHLAEKNADTKFTPEVSLILSLTSFNGCVYSREKA